MIKILSDKPLKAKTSGKQTRQKTVQSTKMSQQIGSKKTYASTPKTNTQQTSKILMIDPVKETLSKAHPSPNNAVIIRGGTKSTSTQRSSKQVMSVSKHEDPSKPSIIAENEPKS